MPLYPYAKRNEELERILSIPYDGVKERALKRFISAENIILQNLAIPSESSFILISARVELALLEVKSERLNPDSTFNFP